MKKLSLILIFLYEIACFGQKEASNWYFGDRAGIRFNNDGTVTELTNGKLSTIEGCTTISDANGNLLFYTDGVTVWNRNHNAMPNGFGLFGDPSSTQSAIVVPQPNNPNLYYIFTVDTSVNQNDPNYGFNYSVVDMTLNGGLGNVTTKNSNLLPVSSEKVTAVVKDCVSQSIWVITFAPNNSLSNYFDTFFAYEVSNLGLNPTPVVSQFVTNIDDGRGYLKLSPDGTKLVSANTSSGLFMYDFEKTTGKVTNERAIIINFSLDGRKPQVPYGVEFSQNNQFLYVSSYFETPQNEGNNPASQYVALLQYNLGSANISSSEVVIDHRQTYRGGLQLGPNGKIYRAMNSTYNQGSPYLSVINAPNASGLACNYVHNSMPLSTNSRQGLPPFITSFFSEKIDIIGNNATSTELFLCDGATYTLKTPNIAGATYAWKRNGIPLIHNTFELEVTQNGLYEVFIDPNTGDCDKTLEGVANITYNPNPTAYDYTLTQCDEDGIAGGITKVNLSEAANYLTGNRSELRATFFTDVARASAISNPAIYAFDANNPQPIYVKVTNTNTGCFDFSELTLDVSITQIPDFTATPLCDELDSEDGINTFNLDAITDQIQTTNGFNYPITYFETYEEALLEKNGLGRLYTNTNHPYLQTLFARVENNNSCYGISKVTLIVHKLPNIETEANGYYCLNTFPETITLNAGIKNGLPNDYTYLWSTGETTNTIQINQPGLFTVTVTNANGCSKLRSITIKPSNTATIETIKVEDVTTTNNTITAIVSGEGNYTFALYNDTGVLIHPYQESNTFENVKPGIYNVFVKDIKNNCGEISEKVSVIGYPKFFTPNGDGFNDTWQIFGVSSMFQPNTKILIFNRFGKLMKEISPLSEGWNGQINGEVVPADDYWFTVKLQDGRIFKNHFSLIR
ncbi:MAG: T9SS type B sorting domain-containing protein [Confluentibacter sp.]|nr:T9SS type B sorting domain-containing protein [Confluentibacter sp.]